MRGGEAVAFGLESFVVLDTSDHSLLVEVTGTWLTDGAEPDSATLLVYTGDRSVARLAPCTILEQEEPERARGTPGWLATYDLRRELLEGCRSPVFELQTAPDRFFPLPGPVTREVVETGVADEASKTPATQRERTTISGLPRSSSSGGGRAAAFRAIAPAAFIYAGTAVFAVAFCLVALRIVATRPDLIPLLAVAATAGLVLLQRPEWIVSVFAALTWAAIGQSFFGGFSPVKTGALALLAVGLWRVRRRLTLAGDVLVFVALIGLPLLATSLLAPGGFAFPRDALRDLTFIPIVAFMLRGPDEANRFVTALCVVAVPLGVGAAYSVLAHPLGLFPVEVDTVAGVAARAAGPLGESNFFALSLAALLPLALCVFARGGRWRPLGLAGALSIVGGILAAGSRGGLVAAGAGLVLFGFGAGSGPVRRAAILVLVAGFALLQVFTAQTASFAGRAVDGRTTENVIALAMFADHPVAGVGPGGYPPLYRDYARRIGNDARVLREPHSLPLQIAAEQGAIGLIGWAGAAWWLVAYARRRRLGASLLGRALLSALATYMVGSLFLHGDQLRIPYLIVGAIFALGAGQGADSERSAIGRA